MALELLHGPAPIQKLDETAITDCTGWHQAAWDDSVGLMTYSLTMGGMCVVQMDGTICLRSSYAPQTIALDLQDDGHYLTVHGTNQYISDFRKQSCTRGDLIGSGAVNYAYQIVCRTDDRYIQAIGNLIHSKVLASSATNTFPLEYTLSITRSLPGFGAAVSKMAEHDVIAIALQSGEIVYYNVATQTQLDRHDYIPANKGAWYSQKHGVFVALFADGTISVYAATPLPDSLSDIEDDDSDPDRGQVFKVKVQVLGDEGEPCPGELIEWSKLGSGDLTATQSETDADGWARTGYAIPTSATVGGSFDITAELKF
jgi:hypothetical protein